ncbi:MAG: hypothetical protein OXT74_06800 [Candidatus Poribacteria bacterium]|nr:hypothetical protein [Candidatus Poribacteria bacterium]
MRDFFGRSYLAVDFVLRVQPLVRLSDALLSFGSENLSGLQAFATDGDRQVRGRILSINAVYAKILEFDTLDEITLPTARVFPSFNRDQLDQLVRAAAPGFDFARARKGAALAAKTGAAKDRAQRIGIIAKKLSTRIFPLELPDTTVELEPMPLPILYQGDGKRALMADKVSEPEVEFRSRRATANIRDGITTFGAYSDEPKDIQLVGVVEPGFEQRMIDLVGRLQFGKLRYRGSERTFATRFQLAQVSTARSVRTDEECRRLIEAFPEWCGDEHRRRVFLVHTSKAGHSIDDVMSPYFRAKRVLLEAGIPCQMVDTPTLQNADYKDLNLALNVVAKTGAAPWVLPESIPNADFFVGLSYTSSNFGDPSDRILGFANVFNEYGRWEFYSGGSDSVPYDRRHHHYEDLVADTLAKLQLSETPSIWFHYSARFGRADRYAILRGARRICPNGQFVFVWINTHHPLRLFDRTAGTDGSLSHGRFVVGGSNQIYLSTTGYNQYRKTIGTPLILEINVYGKDVKSGNCAPIDHRAIARQILSLTKLNWASTDALCGVPITTKYAKDIARLTAAFHRQLLGKFQLHPVLVRTPWFI